MIKVIIRKRYVPVSHTKTYYFVIKRKADIKLIQDLYLFDFKFVDVNKYREIFAKFFGIDSAKFLVELKKRKYESVSRSDDKKNSDFY